MSSSEDEDGGGVRSELYEGPSSSRPRSTYHNEVWPQPFLDSLAYQVAVNASRTSSIGRLAAAPSLSNLFKVCSTWRAISRSDQLWQNLTRQIWGISNLLHHTWYEEYVHRHRTAYNFRISRSLHRTVNFNDFHALACRCLALSDRHLACGFHDGSIRLFDLSTNLHVSTYNPHHRDQLGRFSRAVSGIVLTDSKLVFASLDGDIHVVIIDGPGPRRAHLGNVMEDGVLVDFDGCGRWWVGLYAGVPGRSFHVWSGESEQLVFVGGTLTDPDSLMGWHMLTDLTEPFGRVRVSSQQNIVIACTKDRIMSFDLENLGLVLIEEEAERGVIVTSVDVCQDSYVVVDNGVRVGASVRRVNNFEEICRFRVRGVSSRGAISMFGSMNSGCVFLCVGGIIRVWDTRLGEYLYSVRERIVGETIALMSNERYIVACTSDATINIWDFGSL